ncbi:hypothetical protein [Bradyrhizobium prioriisuperbiae]|uniref:hypothetical protein n=1 Tax=Bradyrhizobium prioriisuperbiae TaxID=2854389 RepID=UPI0028F139CB|nr:hypothetical protein [Bradyrhizobium prioritasuperba]
MTLESETIAVDGFGSFEEMQKAHLALMRALKPNQKSDAAPSGVPEIAAFVARGQKTGAVLAKETERQAAQNILDYWSVETISLSDINEKEWAPPKLAPFDQTRAGGESAPANDEAAAQKRRDARKQIQLAATARLWRDSGRSEGYLLYGQAIEDASAFAASDPDIAELVKASEAAAKARKRNIFLTMSVAAIILLLVAGLWFSLWDNAKSKAHIAQLEAQQLEKRSNQVVQKNDADVQDLQTKITELEKQLSSRRVAVSAEISETVPDAVLRAEASARIAGGQSPTAASQLGYIWLGSDPLPNLQDPVTSAPVKPTAATVGSTYIVNKNLVLRSGLPSPDYIQTTSAGVVPEQTVVTLRSAPQPYGRPTPASLLNPKSGPAPAGAPAVSPTTNQFWAQVEVQPSDKPIVYVEYATGGAAVAQPFVQKLKALGYRIPGVESTDLAKGLNEIRYYYAADKTSAEKLVADIKAMGPQGAVPIHVVDLTAKAGSRNFPGVVELWTDLSGAAQ